MTDTSHTETGSATDRTDHQWSVTDPLALAGREGLDPTTRTFTHPSRDHREADAAGIAVAGITDDQDRLLLLVEPEAGHAVLPHGTVDPGGDWAATVRDHVEQAVGVPVTLDDVAVVRHVDHVIEGEDEPHATTHHVVFAGTPAPDAPTPSLCEGNSWTAGWYDGYPEGVDCAGTSDDDIALFLGGRRA